MTGRTCPGSECVGRGAQSDRYARGTWVYADHASPSTPGALAARVLVADEDLLPLPETVDPLPAAAVGNSGVAAFLPLVEMGRLRAGETALVLGATGAVGELAIQVARLRGAGRVVGAGRDAIALERVRTLGADATVRLRAGQDEEELAARLLAAAGPVDVILDAVYGAPLQAALRVCAARGRRQCRQPRRPDRGGTGRAPPRQAVFLSGYAGLHTPLSEKREALRWLWTALTAGDLKVEIQPFSLDEVAAAWSKQAKVRTPHEVRGAAGRGPRRDAGMTARGGPQRPGRRSTASLSAGDR